MTDYSKATILATEVHIIMSKCVDQEYRISVALPYSYLSQPEKTYPTIYLLDANWYFGIVTETTRTMALCESFPETIVVGIGYPVDEPLADAFKQVRFLRARDLTPITDSQIEQQMEAKQERKVTTGGANAFLRFIETELLPLIESEYRGSSIDRVLTGHSYGGLFTLYTLFHRTELFNGYVAASPSLHYGNGVTFTYEQTFAGQHTALPVKLYLGIGERENDVDLPMVQNLYQLTAYIESRKYEGLALTKHIIANYDHCAAATPAFQAGLQAVLT
jgi:uncharacterized protein